MSRFINLTSTEGISTWICATSVTRAWKDGITSVIQIGENYYIVKEPIEEVLKALEHQDAAYHKLYTAVYNLLNKAFPGGGHGMPAISFDELREEMWEVGKAQGGPWS